MYNLEKLTRNFSFKFIAEVIMKNNSLKKVSRGLIAATIFTTLMITHNMQDAITYGNRLIIMNAGTIIYDVSGEEKKNLTVKALLEKFEEIAPSIVASDKMVLAMTKDDSPQE